LPSYILRPDADAKADWTEDAVGTAFSKLDEAITQPTAPVTGSDRITSATAGQICQVDCTTITLAGGETVIQVKAWFYGSTPVGGSIIITSSISGGGDLGDPVTIPSNSPAGWYSQTYTGSLTQAQVNGLQLKMQNVASVATSEIDAAYIELTTQFGSGGLMMRGMG
jgi:hypothetical protein